MAAELIYIDHDFQGASRILAIPQATLGDQPVTLDQVRALLEGLAWKDSVRVASVSNITLSGPGASINGITLTNGDRFLAKDQTSQSENGIYVFNGSAVAATRALDANTFEELEAATVTVEEGSAAGSTFRQTQVNGVIGTNNVIWASFGTAAPAASESTAGVIQIATQSETDTGTNDLKAITPLKLAQWAGRKRKSIGTIGDGSATSFNIDHNFGTRDVTYDVYRNSGTYDSVGVLVTRPSINRITITTNSAPAAGALAVVVIG